MKVDIPHASVRIGTRRSDIVIVIMAINGQIRRHHHIREQNIQELTRKVMLMILSKSAPLCTWCHANVHHTSLPADPLADLPSSVRAN